jgi:hypothetical protein
MPLPSSLKSRSLDHGPNWLQVGNLRASSAAPAATMLMSLQPLVRAGAQWLAVVNHPTFDQRKYAT